MSEDQTKISGLIKKIIKLKDEAFKSQLIEIAWQHQINYVSTPKN